MTVMRSDYGRRRALSELGLDHRYPPESGTHVQSDSYNTFVL
jgi:hypothetical protein